MAAELHGGVVLVPLLLGSDVEADGHGVPFGAALEDAEGVAVGDEGTVVLGKELPGGVKTVTVLILADGYHRVVGGTVFAGGGVVARGKGECCQGDYQILSHTIAYNFGCKDTKKKRTKGWDFQDGDGYRRCGLWRGQGHR